jgi:hypothetical protein
MTSSTNTPPSKKEPDSQSSAHTLDNDETGNSNASNLLPMLDNRPLKVIPKKPLTVTL